MAHIRGTGTHNHQRRNQPLRIHSKRSHCCNAAIHTLQRIHAMHLYAKPHEHCRSPPLPIAPSLTLRSDLRNPLSDMALMVAMNNRVKYCNNNRAGVLSRVSGMVRCSEVHRLATSEAPPQTLPAVRACIQ